MSRLLETGSVGGLDGNNGMSSHSLAVIYGQGEVYVAKHLEWTS